MSFDQIRKSEVGVSFNILNNVGPDSTADQLEKSMNHKYFKREGTPGNYKYFYTEADYKAGKSSSSEPTSTSTISVQELDKMIREFGKSGEMPSDDVLEDLASRSCYKNRPKSLREAIKTSIEAHSKSSDSNEHVEGKNGFTDLDGVWHDSKNPKEDSRYQKKMSEEGRKAFEKEYAQPGSQAAKENGEKKGHFEVVTEKLSGASIGTIATGGGYSFTKNNENHWKSPKGINYSDSKLSEFIGGFSDFKVKGK